MVAAAGDRRVGGTHGGTMTCLGIFGSCPIASVEYALFCYMARHQIDDAESTPSRLECRPTICFSMDASMSLETCFPFSRL